MRAIFTNRRSWLLAVGAVAFVVLWTYSPRSSGQSDPQQLPTIEERLQQWSEARAGQPVLASVSFDRRLADQQVVQALERSGARPFGVYMFLDGMYGAHTVPPDRAALEAIAEARQLSVEMRMSAENGRKRRAQRVLSGGEESVPAETRDRYTRYLLTLEEQSGKMLQGLRRGVPIIYGLKVAGTAEQIRALAQQPGVAAVEPAVLVDDRISIPQPEPPSEARGRFRSSEIEGLSSAAAMQRVQALAGQPQPDEGGGR